MIDNENESKLEGMNNGDDDKDEIKKFIESSDDENIIDTSYNNQYQTVSKNKINFYYDNDRPIQTRYKWKPVAKSVSTSD